MYLLIVNILLGCWLLFGYFSYIYVRGGATTESSVFTRARSNIPSSPKLFPSSSGGSSCSGVTAVLSEPPQDM